jgi:pimeloyl-ACP methyl ester carboxylesterase
LNGHIIDGRVPIWVETRDGDELTAVVVHDIGGPTLESMDVRGRALLPHLRGHGRSGPVRGGVYILADLAADVVRILRWADGPVVLAGLGRSALVVALAAAVEPTVVRALVLAPSGADIPCTADPTDARQRWTDAVLRTGEIEPAPTLPPPEPLHPTDREMIWAEAPRPIAWVGGPVGAWTVGAPADVVVDAGPNLLGDVRDLIDSMRRHV